MNDDEILAELLHRFRSYDDPDAVYDAEGGAFTLYRWRLRTLATPLQVHVTAAELGRITQIDEETRLAHWPDMPQVLAGLNQFLTDLDDVIEARDPDHHHLAPGPNGLDAWSSVHDVSTVHDVTSIHDVTSANAE